MNSIPAALFQADAEGKWPFGIRLSGSMLAGVATFMSTMNFELLSLDQISGTETSELVSLETPLYVARSPQLAKQYRLYSGSNPNGPSDLPWFDVGNAMVIGGGADHGDDTWIALDGRLDARRPRVVINQFSHLGAELALTGSPQVVWSELAPSIEYFLSMLRSN